MNAQVFVCACARACVCVCVCVCSCVHVHIRKKMLTVAGFIVNCTSLSLNTSLLHMQTCSVCPGFSPFRPPFYHDGLRTGSTPLFKKR